MIRALLALLLAALAAPAAGAEIYTGTIGQAEVVVMIRHEGREVQGLYAYRSQGRPLALTGPEGGAVLHLTERPVGSAEDAPVTGHWRLTRAGDDWTGTWRAQPNTPPRQVRLRRLATTEPDGPPGETAPTRNVGSSGYPIQTPRERLPYMMELAWAPAVVGPVQDFGAGAYRLVEDPRTGVSWPRLTRHPIREAVVPLNEVLEENRAIAIDDTQDCRTARPDNPPSADPMAPHARVTFLGNRLITLTVDGSLDCGGAPNAFHHIVHYDIRTATIVDPAVSLLRLDTEAEQERFRVFWTDRLRARVASGEPLGDCYDPDNVPRAAYRVTARGLVVERGIVASMDIACAVDLIEIPLADLGPYLREGARAYWD